MTKWVTRGVGTRRRRGRPDQPLQCTSAARRVRLRRNRGHINGVRRVLIAALTATAALLAVPGGAGAAPPRIVTTHVDVSVVDSFFTQLCGFEVRFFNVGTFNSKLFVDENGTIVREIDTFPDAKAGWSSPASGRSIVFPASAKLVTEYPNGTALGSAATVTGTGLSAKVPGIPADAGIAVFAGHVAFIDPDGVPIVAFDQLLSIRGHSSDPAVFEAAVCAALSPG